MASVKELAKKYSVDPQWLNNRLVEASIPVVANFSANDGYIEDSIFDRIVLTVTEIIESTPSYEELNEIKKDTIPFDAGGYIYVLFDNNIIVYIGQTVNLPYRIAQHNEIKTFTHVAAIKTNRHVLEITETAYIFKYNPNLNLVNPGIQSILKYAINNA